MAESSSFETYKNLEATGTLKAKDPEGGKLTYTVVQAPKRGEVVLGEDGAFTYTPKKNKVGTDSFSFTVTDEPAPYPMRRPSPLKFSNLWITPPIRT